MAVGAARQNHSTLKFREKLSFKEKRKMKEDAKKDEYYPEGAEVDASGMRI